MKQKILLLGSGGRECAIAWKLSQSELLDSLYIAPGNAGTAQYGTNVSLSPMDFEAVGKFAADNGITMLVVGNEDPLVAGITDYFNANEALKGVKVIGPSKAGAQLEGSKDFAKGFSVQAMYKYLAKNGPYCHSWQLTGVWRNRFAGGLCTFSGFVDLWYNNTVNGNLILMSEPQFWFNLAALRRVSDDFKLSIGTEVEISNNFVYTETGQNNRFYAIPTIACKWEF